MTQLCRRSRAAFLVVVVCAAAHVSAPAAIQSHVNDGVFSPLRTSLTAGTKVTLRNVPVADGSPATLELEAFDVVAADAVFDVHTGASSTHAAFPRNHYFRGQIAGEKESVAVIAVRDNGDIAGMIASHDRRFAIATRHALAPRTRTIGTDIYVSEVAPLDTDDAVAPLFKCDLETVPVPVLESPARVATNGVLVPASDSLTANGTRYLRIAVDTDYELFARRGSSTSVANYTMDLIAAANAVYYRELKTELVLAYNSVYTTPSDPFTVVPLANGSGAAGSPTTTDALREYGAYWVNTPPTSVPYAAAVLVSGKTFPDSAGSFGGIAWLGTVCGGSQSSTSANVPNGVSGRFAFFNGASYGSPAEPIINPNANAPTYQATTSIYDGSYWTLMAFVHELGHVVNALHTHCMALTAAQQSFYGVSRGYVDQCASGGTGCYSGAVSVPVEKGTIMSYCHLDGGYGTDTRFIFGKAGEPTELVTSRITAHLDSKDPVVSAISAASSATIGAASVASVTAIAGSGGAIGSYQWMITNGTINGAATSASVSFTPTADPVTLKVVVLSTLGCGATDMVTIPVVSGTTSSVKGDFNADGKADIVLRNYATGQNAVWIMNGTSLSSVVDLPALTNTSWRIEGTADFNGDGRTDILLRNYSTGQNAIWLMNGTTISSIVDLPVLANTAYHFDGTGDFNGDGKPDIILRNYSTGQNALWLMNGTTFGSIVDLPALPNTAYSIESSGDFSGDG